MLKTFIAAIAIGALTANVALAQVIYQPNSSSGGGGGSIVTPLTPNDLIAATSTTQAGDSSTLASTGVTSPVSLNLYRGSGGVNYGSSPGTVSGPANAFIWQSNPAASDSPGSNPVGGVCADTGASSFCTPNLFVVTDSVDASASAVFYGYDFVNNFGGVGSAGNHHTVNIYFNLAHTPGTIGSAGYTALNVTTLAEASSGAVQAGGIWGADVQTRLSSAATNFMQSYITEFDIDQEVATRDKLGIQITQNSTDSVAGTVENTAIAIANQSGFTSGGWTCGLCFGANSGVNPIASSGSLISTFSNNGSGGGVVGGSLSATVAWGVDLRGYTITNYAFAGNAADFTAAGSLTAPTVTLANCGTNCGLFAPAANELEISVNGTDDLDFGVTASGRWTSSAPFQLGGSSTAALVLTSATGGISMRNGGTILVTPASGSLQHGAFDAAAPVAQMERVQSVVAGTSNTNGANWTFLGSLSTGTGTSGDIIFQTGGTGAGSTAQNAATNALVIKGATQNIQLPAVTTGTPVASLCIDASNNIIKKTTTGSCV